MQNDANVVHLTRVASEPSPNAGAGRLPVILVQVRDKAALQLKQALQALFDNADDTLFEMADRATSNLEQNAFFEAMRDLRLKRKSIERIYLQKVFEEFSALNQVQSGKSVPTLDTVSFDSLSLVQNEELEESVAVDAMVARVMSRDATALAHLSTRLNTLVGRKVDEKSNPLAPRPLTAAFLDACQGLGVEIKVKLIILKLFEKYVLAHCDQLYAEANQILVAAGVLPELKSALPRRQPAVRPEAVRDAGTLQAQAALLDGGQQEVFGALQELLAQVRDNPSFYRRETPENAAPISSNDLMRLLSHLQQHLPGPGAAEFDVRDGVDQLLQRVSHKSGRSRVVGQVDDDVINLVSMLFEFILDDRTLPDSLKALIGRMQIPMLKVALLDKTFFSRGSHPARRLLNEIASASLGWAEHNDARRDSLYQKIEQVVMRLLNDFVDDPAIFAELLEDFIAFTGDERRRSELLEQRTRDAEEGRAKAELARQDVEQVLNQRLLGKVLPEVVVRLLRDAWSKVMLLICLKHGKASAEWREALDTMDELIWSVGPHDDPLSRQQLLERVPGLLKALREDWPAQPSIRFPPENSSASWKPCMSRVCSATSAARRRSRTAPARRSEPGHGRGKAPGAGHAAGGRRNRPDLAGRRPGACRERSAPAGQRRGTAAGRCAACRQLGGDPGGRRAQAALQAGGSDPAHRSLHLRQSHRDEGPGKDPHGPGGGVSPAGGTPAGRCLAVRPGPGVGDRQPAAPQGRLAASRGPGGCRVFSFLRVIPFLDACRSGRSRARLIVIPAPLD